MPRHKYISLVETCPLHGQRQNAEIVNSKERLLKEQMSQFSKWRLLLKERIRSRREQILSFRAVPFGTGNAISTLGDFP